MEFNKSCQENRRADCPWPLIMLIFLKRVLVSLVLILLQSKYLLAAIFCLQNILLRISCVHCNNYLLLINVVVLFMASFTGHLFYYFESRSGKISLPAVALEEDYTTNWTAWLWSMACECPSCSNSCIEFSRLAGWSGMQSSFIHPEQASLIPSERKVKMSSSEGCFKNWETDSLFRCLLIKQRSNTCSISWFI